MMGFGLAPNAQEPPPTVSTNIEVSRIDETDMRAFIRLPFSLYDAADQWCPRPQSEIASWFRRTHHCSRFIGFAPFLATRDGEPVGRCAAFTDRRSVEGTAPAGCVGLYECADDDEAAAALLSAALGSLAADGCEVARGPMDGSFWGQYRFMTSGFAGKSVHGEPRNKAFYPGHFEAAGFKPVKTWSSVFLDRRGEESLLASLADHRNRALVAGYSLRHPDQKRLDAEYRAIHAMVMESYSGFLGFTRISADGFIATFRGLSSVWDPRLVHIAVAPDGSDAGFNITLPDPGRAVRAMRGSSSPLAVLRYLANRDPRPDHVDLYLGALPSAVKAAVGVGALLGYAACEAALEAGRGFVMALISDTSTVKSRIPERPCEVHSYALWERSIDGST
jgi:hypothetical protein